MPTRRISLLPVRFWLTLVCLASSCTMRPLQVGVVFENGWRLGNETLIEREQTLVESAALQTLRDAYRGFDVRFSREPSAARLIKVEDTPFQAYGPGRIVGAGAVGATFSIATVSSVYVDALYRVELAAVGCQDFVACGTKTRAQLLEGLGRAIGATAAHELGHQVGLHFSRDSKCDDCYDGDRANTYVHFFGAMHWSSEALAIMRRVLRPAFHGSPEPGDVLP
jgi:hypothetical protein